MTINAGRRAAGLEPYPDPQTPAELRAEYDRVWIAGKHVAPDSNPRAQAILADANRVAEIAHRAIALLEAVDSGYIWPKDAVLSGPRGPEMVDFVDRLQSRLVADVVEGHLTVLWSGRRVPTEQRKLRIGTHDVAALNILTYGNMYGQPIRHIVLSVEIASGTPWREAQTILEVAKDMGVEVR